MTICICIWNNISKITVSLKCFILLIIFTKLCPIIFNCLICLQNSLNKKYQKNKHITNKVIYLKNNTYVNN